MKKYKIKLQTDGYYCIQKRFLFVFWKDMWFYRDERGFDFVYGKHVWDSPPLRKLEELEKYG